MSTLVAQTISNGTVSTSSANVIRGSARAWVRYNGDAQTVTSSYNVSSVTYNGTGDYTINFTSAFADSNYSMSGSAASAGDFPASIGISSASTTSCNVRLSQHNLGPRNRVFTCASFFS